MNNIEGKFPLPYCLKCQKKIESNELLIQHFRLVHGINIDSEKELKMFRHLLVRDSSLKSKWLSWYNLVKAGLSIQEAFKCVHTKKYQRLRLVFLSVPDNASIPDLIEVLVEKRGFKREAAVKLLGALDLTSIESINAVQDKLLKAFSYKNNELEHYTVRGFSRVEGKEKIKELCTSADSILEKRNSDIKYDEWYRSTRVPGGIAGSLSNRKRSIFESKLIEILESLGYVSTSYITPVFSSDRKFFLHDAYVENCIIEYNGGYWHRDFLKFKKFLKEDYLEEIKKAKFCIDYKRANRPNFILIWEGDFDNEIEAAQFVISCLYKKKNSTFFSSREIDLELYEEICKQQNKQEEVDKSFLKMAFEFSKHSKCVSKKVCALVVKNNRIISLGINGTPSGFPNCNEVFDPENFDRTEHHKWSLENECHAEISAIMQCARLGIAIETCTLYCTLKPCENCAKAIIQVGIKKVVYNEEYDLCGETDNLFDMAEIEMIKIDI
jgi:dCMP deaminase